jgi:cell division transport system ATP-binding protein
MHDRPLISVEQVTLRYGRHEPILRDATCAIRGGEYVFITGPSGSGKTTFLRLLFRDLLPTNGRILIAGQDIDGLRPRQLAYFRRRVGVVFQDFKLLPTRTVFQNVALALRVSGLPRKEIRERVDRILARVNLTHRQDAVPSEISGGEQQRVAIARAMVGNPTILLADEPTGNLDRRIAVEIFDLFEGFNQRGTTVIVATHDLASAVERGKRVLRLEHGSLREGLM